MWRRFSERVLVESLPVQNHQKTGGADIELTNPDDDFALQLLERVKNSAHHGGTDS